MLYHDESGQLYRWEGRFFEPWSVEQLKREAIIALGDEATASRVNGACSLVLALASMPSGRELDDREDWACLENGCSTCARWSSSRMTGLSRHGQARRDVARRKPPKPERWLRFLGETAQTPEVIMQLQGIHRLQHDPGHHHGQGAPSARPRRGREKQGDQHHAGAGGAKELLRRDHCRA